MNINKILYAVLEQMVRSAKKEDNKRVLMLDMEFKGLHAQVFPSVSGELGLKYDQCRQSCLSSVNPKHAANLS